MPLLEALCVRGIVGPVLRQGSPELLRRARAVSAEEGHELGETFEPLGPRQREILPSTLREHAHVYAFGADFDLRAVPQHLAFGDVALEPRLNLRTKHKRNKASWKGGDIVSGKVDESHAGIGVRPKRKTRAWRPPGDAHSRAIKTPVHPPPAWGAHR